MLRDMNINQKNGSVKCNTMLFVRMNKQLTCLCIHFSDMALVLILGIK